MHEETRCCSDSEISRYLCAPARKHELMSVSILDNILADDVHGITEDDLSQDEIKHIKAMITSEKDGSSPPKGKRWLYEVCFHLTAIKRLSRVHVQCHQASVNSST